MAGKRSSGTGRRGGVNSKSGRMYQPVLLLNASYEAIAIILARRAISLLTKDRDGQTVAIMEKATAEPLRYGRGVMLMPSVIRLRDYRSVPKQTRALSRKNILMRDRYTCQYCHESFSGNELTLDHVLPRAQNGESSWENLVAACYPCNHKKSNKTPEQAGMPLARRPKPFNLHTARSLMRISGLDNADWHEFLYIN